MATPIPKQTSDALNGLPEQQREKILRLRELIFETAAQDDRVGPLEETLKWGEPAFLTRASRSGTTIRINRHKKSDHQYALYVPCQTNLVDRFRQLYGDELQFDGNRAIIFEVSDKLPEKPIRHCISMALNYHRDK